MWYCFTNDRNRWKDQPLYLVIDLLEDSWFHHVCLLWLFEALFILYWKLECSYVYPNLYYLLSSTLVLLGSCCLWFGSCRDWFCLFFHKFHKCCCYYDLHGEHSKTKGCKHMARRLKLHRIQGVSESWYSINDSFIFRVECFWVAFTIWRIFRSESSSCISFDI